MRKKKAVSIIILLLVVLAVLGGARRFFALSGPGGAAPANTVAVIYLEGAISGGQGNLMSGLSGTDSVIRQLREAAEDPSVIAAVLRINSPGGSAAASQEIHREAMRFRETGKPLVASFSDVAASGGYWVACAADEIVANPASMTGSIGVIMELTNLAELYEKLGIDTEVIKSGRHKDMGSSSRALDDSEREILQGMVDDVFEQFVDVVAEGRSLAREKVLELADGRIYTGRQAYELGLVDRLGDFYDAIDAACELAGFTGRPRIREMRRRSPLASIFGNVRSILQPVPELYLPGNM